jgi:hypothetical protein
MAPWKLPVIVAAIVVPVVAGFLLAGPGVGVAVGALATVAILVVAVAQRPREAIVPPAPADRRRHILIVVSRPIEDPAVVQQIAREARVDEAEIKAEARVLAPAKIGFLDRWASDVEGARREAQRSLVITVASLAKADVAAEGRVGDEDLVQAVEDQLQSFPATEVILVTGSPDDDPAGDAAAAELGSRLRVDFRHLVLGPGE